MARLDSYLPSPGSAVWRRDVGSPPAAQLHQDFSSVTRATAIASPSESSRVRHVVIRDAEIWEEPAPYVVYCINVLTEHDHWYLYRRYSQFHSLHKSLVRQYGVSKDLLPPKKISGNLSKQLIDKRRKQLEGYLQKIIHSERVVSQSPELQVFLDVPTHNVIKVTDILTRHLYRHGDQLLQDGTPIALSVNEMYAITRRLQLPRDAVGIDSGDVSHDPAHLYSFVHQLERLRISLPPTPCSVSRTPFDLSPFRSLHTLKLDQVPMGQVGGLVMTQQQLERVSVHRSLHMLQELLVESVEERRGRANTGGSFSDSIATPTHPDQVETWRLSANTKLAGTRIVVQPWHRLHTLTLSHNYLTNLDQSLQLLPALHELTLSYNKLTVLSLQYLCLPSLEKLNVSHNQIHTIQDDNKVLERITHLSLSHNRLRSLDGINGFVGVCVLNLSINALASSADLGKLSRLRKLTMLSMAGNPLSHFSAFRIILLAKFLRKTRTISIDGLEPTQKELAKIKTYSSKYGPDPDLWPVAKALAAHDPAPAPSPVQRPRPLSPTRRYQHPGGSITPTTPHVDLTWQINSAGSSTGPAHSDPHSSPGAYTPPAPSNPSPASMHSVGSRSIDRLSFPSSTNSPELPRPQSQGKRHGSLNYAPNQLSSFPGYKRYYAPAPHGPTSQFSSSSVQESKRQFSSSFSGGVVNEEDMTVGSRQNLGGVAEKGFVPRSEPDGQSDVSSTSPDMVGGGTRQRGGSHTPNPVTLSPPPPCTPVSSGQGSEREGLALAISPTMLQSALDALQGIPDKATPLSLTPRQHSSSDVSGLLPGAVTSALTKWISSQSLQNTSGGPSHKDTPLLTPPPSTPTRYMPMYKDSLDQSTRSQRNEHNGISAGELIAALSTLRVSGEPTPGSRGSEGYSVPACTPNEGGVGGSGAGGIEEWARMGIKPQEVIQALSALTIQQEEEEEEEDGHRVCSQQLRDTPSPLLPPLSPLEADSPGPSSYLGLFPESRGFREGGNTAGGVAAAGDSDDEERVLSSCEHEVGVSDVDVGVASDSYEEEVDEALLQQHLTNYDLSTTNEFAELDPYLAIPARPVNAASPKGSPGSVEEMGVDVSSDMSTASEVGVTREEVGVAPDVEGEESTSPVESVLYSHLH